MIRPIVKSTLFLEQPSEAATEADLAVADDLLDTLALHHGRCVGMAANMIGIRKRIIVFADNGTARIMLNPEIVSSQAPWQAEEGCLSLVGKRSATRYKRIKVRYQDRSMKWRTEAFAGFTAQIIQHEIDHCNGIVI